MVKGPYIYKADVTIIDSEAEAGIQLSLQRLLIQMLQC